MSGSREIRREDTVLAAVGYTRVQLGRARADLGEGVLEPGGGRAEGRLETRCAAGGDDGVEEHRVLPAGGDAQGQPGQIGQLQAVACGQRVRGGQRDQQRIVPEAEKSQARSVFEAADEGRVQPSGTYFFQARAGVEGLELEAGRRRRGRAARPGSRPAGAPGRS